VQRIYIERTGGPEVLRLREEPDPTPGRGQVRIKVQAAGVNFADVMARMGLYPDAPPLPAVVGYEVAGEIDAVGADVDPSRVGEPVLALCHFGGYSTHVVVDSLNAVVRPASMDAVTAASIPVVGATAWMMLVEQARIRPGDKVLVHSAGGGVGLAALEVIKAHGGWAAGTASGAKHAKLKELGYDKLVDYRTQDFEKELRDIQFDIILDPVGGRSWRKGLNLLRAGGRMVVFGMSSNANGESRNLFHVIKNMLTVPWLAMNPIALMNNNHGVFGTNLGHMWDEGERIAPWLQEILKLWEAGKYRPAVHAAVPFANAPEAHAIIHRRENVGKVVLVT